MSAHRFVAVLSFAPAVCLALCGISGGGCVAPQTQTASPPKPNAAARSQSNARANRALEDLASAVKAWAKTPPSSGTRPSAPAKSLVSIDFVVLARQHPAWRLADALERDSSSRTVQPIDRSSATGVALAPIQFAPDVRIFSVAVAPGAVLSSFAPLAETSFVLHPPITGWEPTDVAPKRIEARALPRALDVARRRQDNAFLAFLNDAASRQKNARFDAAETQRVALDAQIDAERHAPLDEISPSLLDDPVALELTNLKLRLLITPPEAQPALLRRIAALEAPWRARLREQEKARERELRELRRTRPFRLEREGNARIATFLKDTQRDDTTLRANLRDTHLALVNADFAPNNAILGIALPSMEPSRARRAPFPATVSSVQKQMVSVETFFPTLSSQRTEIAAPPASNAFGSAFNVALPALAARPDETRVRQKVRQLRLQALRESQLRAQAMARRNGWTLVKRARGVRDETRSAMRFMNMR